MNTTLSNDYLMGRTSAEYQRLRMQAAIWEASVQRVFDAIGIMPGMNCLDAGCGPGEVMRLLGQRVGPTGHVTGIDVDANLGQEALHVLKTTIGDQFSFHALDLETDIDFPNAPYDLVYARLTVVHLSDPVEALRKLWSYVKPGGTLLIQEYDINTMQCYPLSKPFNESAQILNRIFDAAKRDLSIGSKIPRLFVDAEIGQPTGTDVFGLITPLSQLYPMIASVYKNMQPIAHKFGLDDEQNEYWLAALQQQATGNEFYTTNWPSMVATWKQKPK